MILHVFLEMPIEAHCYANYPCFRIGPNLPDGLQPPSSQTYFLRNGLLHSGRNSAKSESRITEAQETYVGPPINLHF